jgi:hypothetical protein
MNSHDVVICIVPTLLQIHILAMAQPIHSSTSYTSMNKITGSSSLNYSSITQGMKILIYYSL